MQSNVFILEPNKQAIEAGWIIFQKARAYVKTTFPYFFPTIMGLIPVEVQGIGTLGVSPGLILGIDFEWFSSLEVEVAGGCLIHEGMHILRDLDRLNAMPDKELANQAFDIPINDDLKRAGVKLPSWAIYSSTYDLPEGFSGEKYYELLQQRASRTKAGQLCIDGIPTSGKVGAGKCGGCAGTPGEGEEKNDKESGRSPTDVEYFKKTGLKAITDAAKSGELKFGRGNKSAFFEELLEFTGKEKPVVPWRQVATNAYRRATGHIKCGQIDYSLSRPSKRSYTRGIIRPGMISREVETCYIEDSSGSMGAEQLKAGRVEIAEAMVRLGLLYVWYFCADTESKMDPQRIRVPDLKTLPVLGRGGTSFIQPIEIATNLRPRPKIIIYATDGDGYAPATPPKGVEFIWLLVPGPWTVRPCNWGTQILMSDLREERDKYGFT